MGEINKGGLTKELIAGIGAIIVVVIVILVVISSIDNANLLEDGRVTTTVSDEVGQVNETTYTLAGASLYYVNDSFTIVSMWDYDINQTIVLANASTSAAGVVTNATAVTFDNVLFNYTYTTQSAEERTTDDMIGNYTSGIDNVSGKIPTILLIAAVVILFGVIVLLVRQSEMMGIGGGREGSL